MRLFARALCLAAMVSASAAASSTDVASRLVAESAGLGPAAAVYAEREGAPIWLAEDGARAAALIAALREAPAHALPVERYAPDRLARLVESGPEVDAEIALTRAFLLYARDVSSGLLEPRSAASYVRATTARPDPAALLRRVASAPDVAAHVAALAPPDPGYARLAAAYARLGAGEAAWGESLRAGRSLRLGDRDLRVAALRERLRRLGDYAPAQRPIATPVAATAVGAEAAEADPAAFDPALDLAVRAFQRRHGLNDDGVVGPRTHEALDASLSWRLQQIAVNLERMRWLNRPLGHRRIVVNQADFTVALFEGERTLFEERVVVGKRRHQTVEFSDEMEYLVLNPTWHVPRSIATEELLPQIQADPSVLSQRNMTLARTDGGPMPFDPSSHDFTVYTAGDFPYRIRQRPSAGNALGRVKFMFPNDYAIYLHDTPSKRLFARDKRAFSHGCVRVQDPLRLAELLLAPQMDDPRGFIDDVLATGRERYVNLAEHVPVHLIYRTAWVGEDGALQFRGDVYGRDAQTMAALRAEGYAGRDS